MNITVDILTFSNATQLDQTLLNTGVILKPVIERVVFDDNCTAIVRLKKDAA